MTVRDTLCQAEEKISNLGLVLRPVFFPGQATAADDEAFEAAVAKWTKRHYQAREGGASSGRAGAEEGSSGLGRRTMQSGDQQ